MFTQKATAIDAEEIVQLMNLAYRGEGGWTTEKNLVEGNRCNLQDMLLNLESNDFVLLTYRENGKLIACIGLTQKGVLVEIGSFSVLPSEQNKGIGHKMLQEAEKFAFRHFKTTKLTMSVLSGRDELFSFYERRGYVRTGKLDIFPKWLDVGTPVNDAQTMELLVKGA